MGKHLRWGWSPQTCGLKKGNVDKEVMRMLRGAFPSRLNTLYIFFLKVLNDDCRGFVSIADSGVMPSNLLKHVVVLLLLVALIHMGSGLTLLKLSTMLTL